MPQIWPMNWILLFFLFISTYMIFLSVIYFIPDSANLTSSCKSFMDKKTMNWKW